MKARRGSGGETTNRRCGCIRIGHATDIRLLTHGHISRVRLPRGWPWRRAGRDDLRRIEADIDPRNEPSCRPVDRLGFQREGYLRERWQVNGEVTGTAVRPSRREVVCQ